MIIFIFGISIFRVIVESSFLFSALYELGGLTISSGTGYDLVLTKGDGLFYNIWQLALHSVKISVYSAIDILFNLPDLYWTLSLYIDGQIKYSAPASTMWATTYLSSIYLYLSLY